MPNVRSAFHGTESIFLIRSYDPRVVPFKKGIKE